MTGHPYTAALETTLTEIKKLCPGIQHSFLFTKEGTRIAGDADTDDKIVNVILDTYQSLVEKADTIGGLKAFNLTGKNGTLTISIIDDMYFLIVTMKDADTTNLDAATRVILPTVLSLLNKLISPSTETKLISPSTETKPSLIPPSSKQLTVDVLTGFSMFGGDSVQIDEEQLQAWATLLKQEKIGKVEIKAFNGNSTQCKVKNISDKKLRGKALIRIPEKICKTLKARQGDLMTVQPCPEDTPLEKPVPEITVEQGAGFSYEGY